MCAGNDKPMVASAMYKIKELRTIWNSSLPVTIAHCHELSHKTIADIRRIHEQSISQLLRSNEGRRPLLDFVDMCVDAPMAKKERLRGWFCKPAALVMSSYTETLLIDTDTIWFQNPDRLFEAPLYKDTGAMFFRDRAIRFDKDNTGQERGVVRLKHVKKFVQEQSAILKVKHPGAGFEPERFSNWDEKLSESLYLNGGHGANYVWKSDFDMNATDLAHVQESSAVILDASRLPRTVQAITEFIPTFSIGYGDKEMYWVAATLAGEDFSFEPYLEGLYGDCGVVFHFDPSSITREVLKAGQIPTGLPFADMPLYLNGQYAAEKVLYLGSMMESNMTVPRLATPDRPVEIMGEQYSQRTKAPCGACKMAGGCFDVPPRINRMIYRLQEYQLSTAGKPPEFLTRTFKRIWDRLSARFSPAWLED